MSLVIVATHVNTILLDIISVIAETIHIILSKCKAHLQQLIVLIVAHGQCAIDGALEEEVHIRCKTNPLVVKMLLVAHAHSDLAESCLPHTHTSTHLLKRILIATRNNDCCVVHGCLQNVYQGDAIVDQFQSLTKL